jgi:hypothetical protein
MVHFLVSVRNAEPDSVWQSVQWQITVSSGSLGLVGDVTAMAATVDFHDPAISHKWVACILDA